MRKKNRKNPKLQRKKIVETEARYPSTHIHDRSLSFSIKSDSVKLFLWVQNSHISKIKIIFIDGFSY